MNEKHGNNFILGFIVAAAAVGWLYWLWRQNREIAPEPILLKRTPGQLAAEAAPTLSKRAESARQVAEQVESEEKVEEEETAVAPPPADSLTEIKGIGPTYERRLNEAGIYTFVQLADCTPDQLREITDVLRWDPVDWIREAQQRVG